MYFSLLEGKPLDEAPEAVMTCLSDLDCGLQRVASRILSCRNQPAELDPSAMTRQLQEAQVGNAHREEVHVWTLEL